MCVLSIAQFSCQYSWLTVQELLLTKILNQEIRCEKALQERFIDGGLSMESPREPSRKGRTNVSPPKRSFQEILRPLKWPLVM